MNALIILCLLFFNSLYAARTIPIWSTKDVYPMNFDAIYRLNICNSYSTVIEPPQGYVLQDIILGDSKLFKAEKTENRAIVKRLAPDNATTNLVLVLEGQDKVSHSLTFELAGAETPRISNVQFMAPEQRSN